MMYPFRHILAAALLATTVSAAPAVAEDAGALRRAMGYAGVKDWPAAVAAADQSGPIARALIDWMRLRAGNGSFAEYQAFAAAYPDWPGMDLLYRRAEARMTPATPGVLAWFSERQPLTMAGADALIAARIAAGDKAGAAAEAKRAWLTMDFDPVQEDAFANRHQTELLQWHEERVFALLDRGEWQAAQRMLDRASPAAAPLANARIALQSGRREGVDGLILALPDAQRQDAGLAIDRFNWRRKAKMTDLARDLLIERSTSAKALGRPEAWAGPRADYVRAALRAGDWALAEKIARNHFLPPGAPEYSDLEWLAGYAALRAGANDRALGHFRHLETVVGAPISLSRALYWQGRALEAAGDQAAANAEFARAAGHQSTYYGQLAAERLGQAMTPDLAVAGRAVETLPQWRGTPLRNSSVWQAAVWANAAGDSDLSRRFLLQLAETAPPDDIARMARMALEWRQPHVALRLAKAAASKGAVWPAAYFPLTGLETHPLGLPPELVMAIARRESEFNVSVASGAGALGLMQVMPDTARMMAQKLGVPYERAMLTESADYNARIGSAYLTGLRDRFGPSIALVAAGYNAGPGRPARWITQFGDPRNPNTDPVDWVEMIPFDETRNYVMRVAEALPAYRARIKGAPVPITLIADLSGGGVVPSRPPAPRPANFPPPIPEAAPEAAPEPLPSAMPGSQPDPQSEPQPEIPPEIQAAPATQPETTTMAAADTPPGAGASPLLLPQPGTVLGANLATSAAWNQGVPLMPDAPPAAPVTE
ncbi:transglycosylase SLT domain-containing protein [Paracoccus pacificus]|uniref:Transglycosylase SLT domain-containing protein n=1 Tax=Paracoccus pacificus TaxID=1463598 RepID=A0ABW4R8L2_9RHOB